MTARATSSELNKRKALAAEVAAKKKKIKVVDVELSEIKDSAPARAEKPSGKKVAAAKALPGKEVPAKTAAPRIEKTLKKHDLKISIERSAKTAKPQSRYNAKPQEEAPAPIQEPTPEMLRAFRQSLKQKRAQAAAPAKAAKSGTGSFLAKQPDKGKKFRIDLRIHTPGTVGYFASGGINPGPALRRLARVKGLNTIALTDYYNASYLDLVQEGAAESDLIILPAFDIRCCVGPCRDVSMTAIFPETYHSADLYRVLDELQVPKEAYGHHDYCLEIPIGEIIAIVERNGGLLIPSRLDKTPYRQLAIPELVNTYGMRAFDLVHIDNVDYFKDNWPHGGFVFFSFSNASALAQIGSRAAKIRMTSPGFEGIKELAQRKLPN